MSTSYTGVSEEMSTSHTKSMTRLHDDLTNAQDKALHKSRKAWSEISTQFHRVEGLNLTAGNFASLDTKNLLFSTRARPGMML